MGFEPTITRFAGGHVRPCSVTLVTPSAGVEPASPYLRDDSVAESWGHRIPLARQLGRSLERMCEAGLEPASRPIFSRVPSQLATRTYRARRDPSFRWVPVGSTPNSYFRIRADPQAISTDRLVNEPTRCLFQGGPSIPLRRGQDLHLQAHHWDVRFRSGWGHCSPCRRLATPRYRRIHLNFTDRSEWDSDPCTP